MADRDALTREAELVAADPADRAEMAAVQAHMRGVEGGGHVIVVVEDIDSEWSIPGVEVFGPFDRATADAEADRWNEDARRRGEARVCALGDVEALRAFAFR